MSYHRRRATQTRVGEGAAGVGKLSGPAAEALAAAAARKAKEVERIKLMQERQLQEAAKHNEEAQAVINELRTSLLQLEGRFKQVVHMYICDRKRRGTLPRFKQHRLQQRGRVECEARVCSEKDGP